MAIKPKSKADEGEYGYEGDMAMSQLRSIIRNSESILEKLEPQTDLPEWVQSKITLAEDYISTAANYLHSELEEEKIANKPDASMAMTDQLKKKMITDKDKQTLGKVATLMASAKNKDKKNEYVRQLGLKAMKAGKVDPARGHIPTRAGREELKKEGFDPEPADIAAELVKKHGKGKVTSKHLDAYETDRDTHRGLDRGEIMKHVKKLSEATVPETEGVTDKVEPKTKRMVRKIVDKAKQKKFMNPINKEPKLEVKGEGTAPIGAEEGPQLPHANVKVN